MEEPSPVDSSYPSDWLPGAFVMAHREHLMGKLGVHSRTELIKYALKRGVIRV